MPESSRSGLASVRACACRSETNRLWQQSLPCLEQSEAKGIRPIEAIVGEAPILSEQLLELARWIGAYYCCPIETVMRSVLPQVIRHAEVGWKKQLFVQPARKIDSDEIEKLRKRAPRQAELLEAISQLERPMRAAELFGKRRSITRRCVRW